MVLALTKELGGTEKGPHSLKEGGPGGDGQALRPRA